MQKVIIDTDIGDDVDDALALAMALNSPELDIIGITTVFRNTTLRTKLAKKLLQIYNREDIPVIKGIEKPLINEWDNTLVPPQSQVIEEEISINEKMNAVDFILDKIMNLNEKVIIVSIGPLTNIATILIKEPMLREKTELYMMGGMYSQAFPEWNIYCDPEASKVVFDSGISITMVGLDVTLKCKLDEKPTNTIFSFGSKKTQFLSELIKIWQEGDLSKYPILHDPLAIATLVDPSLTRREKMSIKVETRGEYTRGVTAVVDNPFYENKINSSVNVCVDVDKKNLFEFFLKRILI